MTGDPLYGRTIVVTRPECRAAELNSRLREAGAEVLAVPSIRFARVADRGPWNAVLAGKDSFTHIIFTSAVAVDTFVELCSEAGLTAASWLESRTTGAIGAATAASMESAGVTPELAGRGSSGAEFARKLTRKEGLGAGHRILLPGSDIARGELASALADAGARVEAVPIYQTIHEEAARAGPLFEALDRGELPDAVTFASPSALEGFLRICGKRGREVLESATVSIISLGSTTSEAIEREGLAPAAQARRPGAEALIDALREALADRDG